MCVSIYIYVCMHMYVGAYWVGSYDDSYEQGHPQEKHISTDHASAHTPWYNWTMKRTQCLHLIW